VNRYWRVEVTWELKWEGADRYKAVLASAQAAAGVQMVRSVAPDLLLQGHTWADTPLDAAAQVLAAVAGVEELKDCDVRVRVERALPPEPIAG
jgi:hypothetical protein